MVKQKLTGLLGLLLVVATGCASTGEDPSAKCSWFNAPVGTLVGAGVGTGVGAIIADRTVGVTMSQGLGVGAVAGGLVGSLIGDRIEVNCLKDQIADLTRQRDELAAALKTAQDENEKLKAEIDRLNKRIAELEGMQNTGRKEIARANIPDDVLFASGSDQLTEHGRGILDGIATQLKNDYPNKFFSVEGHTDSDPIRYSHWKSNWELGAARSLRVLHYMQDTHGFTGADLSATSFGEYHPTDSNDSSEGKSKNRRVEIVVYDNEMAPGNNASNPTAPAPVGGAAPAGQ